MSPAKFNHHSKNPGHITENHHNTRKKECITVPHARTSYKHSYFPKTLLLITVILMVLNLLIYHINSFQRLTSTKWTYNQIQTPSCTHGLISPKRVILMHKVLLLLSTSEPILHVPVPSSDASPSRSDSQSPNTTPRVPVTNIPVSHVQFEAHSSITVDNHGNISADAKTEGPTTEHLC